MTASAIFLFSDNDKSFAIRSETLGDPKSASAALMKALDRSFTLPKFDPAEFACGFIAANKPEPQVVNPAHVGAAPIVKPGGGELSLVQTDPGEYLDTRGIDNVYQIVQSTSNDYLIVYGYAVDHPGVRFGGNGLFFRGPIHHFARQYGPEYGAFAA